MSIKDDNGLIDKYRELEDSMSMSIKIRHDQVCEIVVADLMSKYLRGWMPYPQSQNTEESEEHF